MRTQPINSWNIVLNYERLTSIGNWDTTQVSADTSDDEPFWILDTVGIRLWVTKLRNVDLGLTGNIFSTTVLDEDWLSTPLEKASFSYKKVER